MKKILFLSIYILVVNFTFAQVKIDTVYVSYNNTTYLVFPKEVNLVDIPDKENYANTLDGKTVFIKPLSKGTPSTTFLVKCGEEDYFQGIILYKEAAAKTFYDFRSYEQTIEEKTTKTTTVKTIVKEEKLPEPIDTMKLIHKDRINILKMDGKRYKTVGIIQDGIYLGLSSVRHDEHASYIKLQVNNSSNVAYVVDYVAFEVMEDRVVSRNEVKQHMEDVPRAIPSKEHSYLYYVTPLIAIPENTELKVTLREKGGLRTLVLYIPAKTITTAPTF